MNAMIIYGGKYRSARCYAEILSEQTGIPCCPYTQWTADASLELIVYIGSLYAGGIPGLRKTFARQIPTQASILIATVGLSDPKEPETVTNITAALKQQLPEDIFQRASFYHLRGAIDHAHLSRSHKVMMSLMYRQLRKKPVEQRSAEDRAFLETYGKQISFIDPKSLEPLIAHIQTIQEQKGGSTA